MTRGRDEPADVLVVGGGAGGLVAAATAANQGVRVTLIERAETLGGTAAWSVGELWIPANHHLDKRGIADPRTACLRFMAQLSYPDSYHRESPGFGLTDLQYRLLCTYVDRAKEAVAYLEQAGILRTKISPAAYGDPLGHPEYQAEHLDNLVPQGRHLIVDNGDPAFGLRGAAYVEQLAAALADRNVTVLLGQRVVDVSTDSSGRVIGVVVETEGGERTLVPAGAVVFATGGFGHDAAARATYLPAPVDGVAAATTNTGDFLRIGRRLGAELANMTQAYLGNTPFEPALTTPRIPQLTHFPFGDSMIWVDHTGRRVVNEKGLFTERARAHFHWDPVTHRHSRRVLIQVFDATVNDHPHARDPLPRAGAERGHVLTGQTWEELARAVDERLASLEDRTGGIRLAPGFAASLREAVATFGDSARSGEDPDFGRGGTPIQVCYEQRLHEGFPNPTMAPFSDDGPYFAVLVGAAMFDTAGGPVVNEAAEVLDTEGRPIPALYGAGSCVASPGGQAYWSGGAPMGLALTFGYVAGRNAAAISRG